MTPSTAKVDDEESLSCAARSDEKEMNTSSCSKVKHKFDKSSTSSDEQREASSNVFKRDNEEEEEESSTTSSDEQQETNSSSKNTVKKRERDSNEEGKKSNKRSRRSLPAETVEYLQQWMVDHVDHPYPNDHEKRKIMTDTGIEMKQLKFWFVNNRRRYWRPMMDAWAKKTQQEEEEKERKKQQQIAMAQQQLVPPNIQRTTNNRQHLQTPRCPLPDPATFPLMHPAYLWAFLTTVDGKSHPPIW